MIHKLCYILFHTNVDFIESFYDGIYEEFVLYLAIYFMLNPISLFDDFLVTSFTNDLNLNVLRRCRRDHFMYEQCKTIGTCFAGTSLLRLNNF